MSYAAMTCEEAVAEFRPYAEGELDAAAASNVQGHLADCPDCCVEFHQRRKLYTFVAQTYGGRRISDGFARGADQRLQTVGTGAASALAFAQPAAVAVIECAEASAEPNAGFDVAHHRRFMRSLGVLFAALGALPCWAFSGLFHVLIITTAILVGWSLQHEEKSVVIVTDLVRPHAKDVPPVKTATDVMQEVQQVTVQDVKMPSPDVVVMNAEDIADVSVAAEAAGASVGEHGEDNVLNGDAGERGGVGLGGGDLGAQLGGGVPLPGGGTGMKGSIAGVNFAGKKLALIFDSSLSMQQVVEFAKLALVEFLGEAKGKGTIDFYSEINEVPSHKLYLMRNVPLKTSKETVLKWFEGLPKGGNNTKGEAASSVYWAFQEAMTSYPDMVIFVTDWQLHSPNREYDMKRQTDEIRKILEDVKANMPKCVFFTQTAAGAPRDAMDDLAKLTGGTVKLVKKK